MCVRELCVIGVNFTQLGHVALREQQVHARDLPDAVLRADDLQGRTYRIRIVFSEPRDHGIRLTRLYHHAPEIQSVTHPLVRFIFVETAPLPFLERTLAIF